MLRYSCTALPAGQKGGIKPDADGYYYLIIGGLDIANSRGEWWDWEASKHVFEKSSVFIKRIQNGMIYGEKDHPIFEVGMTDSQFLERNMVVIGDRKSHFIKEIEVKRGKATAGGRAPMLIWGHVKPTDTPFGRELKDALEDPNQNVCFSIRSFAKRKPGPLGITKSLDKVVTFDWVSEPGISLATKFNTLANEGAISTAITNESVELEDRVISTDSISDVISKISKSSDALAVESDTLAELKDLLDRSDKPASRIREAGFSSW